MAVLDYPKLNRIQRTAVFLIVIGQEAAATLVRSFADGELEAVCREMAKLPVIDNDARQDALAEFASLVDMGYESALGGSSYVRGTLELARGEQRAAYLFEKVAPPSTDAGAPAPAQFEGMDMRQLFSLLKGEQPQTVAFLLSQLDLSKAGEILRMLEPEQRAEVIERLAEMDASTPEVVQRLANQFNKRGTTPKIAAPSVQRSGGAPFVANLLKTLDKDTSRSLLAVLQNRNAELSETIRKKLFAFEDLATLTNADLQRIMREVEPAELTAALKSPKGEALVGKFTSLMSKRAAESMVEEIALMAPLRPKEQEAAQDRVLSVVRRLEEQGDITFDQGEPAHAA